MPKLHPWNVSDELWARVEPLIPPRERDPNRVYLRKPGAGRPTMSPRRVFEAIMFVARTGCQWKALPKEAFGSASAVHKYFLRWADAGFFKRLWQAGLDEYDDVIGILWQWQSVDGCIVKAPLARESVGPNPTDRGKIGGQASCPRRRSRRAAVPVLDGCQPA